MRSFFAFIMFAVLSTGFLYAQEKNSIVYTDAQAFPLYGKCVENTSARYERLPAELEGRVRPPVWHLGRNSAGLYIRFKSDSPSIYAKWENSSDFIMDHQTPVGTRGLDLYAIEDEGEWRFAGCGRPNMKSASTTAKIISNMEPKMREYMLYLPLYNGVKTLEIGVEEGCALEKPAVDRPVSGSPVVMYGTSILQGGCANRPGMAHTSIISRRLDREVVNLGFSGNALLDFEIAELMAKVENPALFVLDYVPNASSKMIDEKGEEFFKIIRNAHPAVPVIFVEDPEFTHCYFDLKIREEVEKKNISQRKLYEKLKAQGEKEIYYVSSKGMIGDDAEATVDGIHFTDLGMMRYASHLMPVMRKALRKAAK